LDVRPSSYEPLVVPTIGFWYDGETTGGADATGDMIMPADASIDCHAHVVDPRRFAFVDGAGYRPRPHETGTREAFAAVLDAHGVAHALLVQPSCYGTDNAAMLDAMARSPGRFKGIAVVAPDVGERELATLADRGVVGVRFNLVNYDRHALAKATAAGLLDRLRDLAWFAQIFAQDEQWPELAAVLLRAKVKVLIDHFGVRDIAGGAGSPGFRSVLELGRSGLAAVKLSAPFRLVSRPGAYGEVDGFAAALLDAFGVGGCVWGSDWPFLGVRDALDYGDLLAALARWLPDPTDRLRVLRHNPIDLFGFGR
jgi:predicted TIM-barrel fold metal-dependent hydrolase